MMEYKKWQKGGLRPNGAPGFDTPTGKFEIWSTILGDYGYEPLPKYTEPVEGPIAAPEVAEGYPPVFNSGARPQTYFRSQHHGVPGLVDESPEPTVEINVEDAAERGISTGDLVEVRTPRGAVPFRARVTDAIVQGAIGANMGGGTAVGPHCAVGFSLSHHTTDEHVDRAVEALAEVLDEMETTVRFLPCK